MLFLSVVIESGLDSTVNVLPCLEITRCLATSKSFIYIIQLVKSFPFEIRDREKCTKKVMQSRGDMGQSPVGL